MFSTDSICQEISVIIRYGWHFQQILLRKIFANFDVFEKHASIVNSFCIVLKCHLGFGGAKCKFHFFSCCKVPDYSENN